MLIPWWLFPSTILLVLRPASSSSTKPSCKPSSAARTKSKW
jgi:hypothetical protein